MSQPFGYIRLNKQNFGLSCQGYNKIKFFFLFQSHQIVCEKLIKRLISIRCECSRASCPSPRQYFQVWTNSEHSLWLTEHSEHCDQLWPVVTNFDPFYLTKLDPLWPNVTPIDPMWLTLIPKIPAWLVLLFLSARACEWEACLRQFHLKVNVKLFSETEKLSFGRWFYLNFMCCKKYWIHKCKKFNAWAEW